VKLKALVGSGDRIGLFTLPFLLAGVALNVAFPAAFAVGGPPPLLAWVSVVVLAVGVVVWAWSVVLILRDVPRGRLITSGPFAVVRHPLYTGVALLVLPWAGFLLNTWLGAVLGIVLFAGARMFEGGEERALASRFGSDWDRYAAGVKIAGL
jgi:protein-S-isoprenylcysteine O-methyltransferase Ste14